MLASPTAPLLPAGDALFEGLPAPAIVLDQLPAAVGDGVIVVRERAGIGRVVVRDRLPAAASWDQDGRVTAGEQAVSHMRELSDATVSAARLDPAVVDVLLPFLLSGAACYRDLRLGWVDWHQLLADLRQRGGSHLAQVSTPDGRGATVIVDGEHRLSYVDGQAPAIGDVRLLDDLAGHPGGAVTVFEVAAGAAPEVAPAPAGGLRPPRAEVLPAAMLPSLKLVARDRLHRSSSRVERLLDEAAEEARPLDAVLADIRGLAIRGVLPSTLAGVAEDMRSAAAGGA